MTQSPVPFVGLQRGRTQLLLAPLCHQQVCVRRWLALGGATLFLHAASTFPLAFSPPQDTGQLAPVSVGPFPREVLFSALPSGGLQSGRVLGLNTAIRKELTAESHPRMRSRPLRAKDEYVLPGVLFSGPQGLGQIKTNGGAEGLPSEAAMKGAFCLAAGPEPRLVRANGAQLPAL